jgi:hypothetical protein
MGNIIFISTALCCCANLSMVNRCHMTLVQDKCGLYCLRRVLTVACDATPYNLVER